MLRQHRHCARQNEGGKPEFMCRYLNAALCDDGEKLGYHLQLIHITFRHCKHTLRVVVEFIDGQSLDKCRDGQGQKNTRKSALSGPCPSARVAAQQIWILQGKCAYDVKLLHAFMVMCISNFGMILNRTSRDRDAEHVDA